MPGITIHTAHGCGYCRSAEQLLQRKGVRHFSRIEIDLDPNALDTMIRNAGRRTVPQIYIGSQHNGGSPNWPRSTEAVNWTNCCAACLVDQAGAPSFPFSARPCARATESYAHGRAAQGRPEGRRPVSRPIHPHALACLRSSEPNEGSNRLQGRPAEEFDCHFKKKMRLSVSLWRYAAAPISTPTPR